MDSIEVYVWLIVFIVLTAIEMATFQLVTIWFAVGAVAAFITSLFSTSLEIQLIVFLAVSMLLLILVRPIAGRFLQTRKQRLMQPFFRLRVWRLLRRQLTVKQQRSLCRQIWLRLQEH